jgi:predicted nucleic acid-binding protein
MDFNEQEIVFKIGVKGLEDLNGLRGPYQVAQHYGTIDFVTSENTLQELHRRAHDDKGFSRLQFGAELLDWWTEQLATIYDDEDFTDSQTRAQTWLDYGVFDFLPDSEDRLLIAAAFAAHCSIFLTMDFKTILPYRDRIYELTGMRVLRPSEYWQEVNKGL